MHVLIASRVLCLILILYVAFLFVKGARESEREPGNKPNWDLIVCGHARMDAHVLREWVLWNVVAGVQHFVIFDNNDISPDGLKDSFDEAVAPLQRAGFVTVHRYFKDVLNNPALALEYGLDRGEYDRIQPFMAEDNPLKQRCFELYRHKSKWIAFIDTDEAFVSLKPGLTLTKFLLQPKITEDASVGGVGFFWRLTHYGQHFRIPPDGALEHFKPCSESPRNRHIKTIVRAHSADVLDRIRNAHYLNYKPGYKCINEANLKEEGGTEDYLRSPNWTRPESVHFQLNHYFSRSVEEFLLKSSRGTYFNCKHDIFRADFVEHTLCEAQSDLPTKLAAIKVRRLRHSLNISYGPDPVWTQSGRDNLKKVTPLFRLFVDALDEHKTWDEKFYISNGNKKPECSPRVHEDGLLHFWRDGFARNCSYRFISVGA